MTRDPIFLAILATLAYAVGLVALFMEDMRGAVFMLAVGIGLSILSKRATNKSLTK